MRGSCPHPSPRQILWAEIWHESLLRYCQRAPASASCQLPLESGASLFSTKLAAEPQLKLPQSRVRGPASND